MAKNIATTSLRKPTEIQKTWIKLLQRKSGATRFEMQEAAKSAFPPDFWHLNKLAIARGFALHQYVPNEKEREQGYIARYQFTAPGARPTIKRPAKRSA